MLTWFIKPSLICIGKNPNTTFDILILGKFSLHNLKMTIKSHTPLSLLKEECMCNTWYGLRQVCLIDISNKDNGESNWNLIFLTKYKFVTNFSIVLSNSSKIVCRLSQIKKRVPIVIFKPPKLVIIFPNMVATFSNMVP